MSKTQHMQHRMSERNISEMMVHLVDLFGANPPKGDKTILDKSSLCLFEKNLRILLKEVEKMKKRGGLTLIESKGVKITAYFNDSYKPNLKGA